LPRAVAETLNTITPQRAQRTQDWLEASSASLEESEAPPLYEVLADTFDLKSARFASIRPRLVKHLQFVIADLKVNVAWNPEEKQKLERAREILNLLNPEPRRACASYSGQSRRGRTCSCR
jgi:hypothetical protein